MSPLTRRSRAGTGRHNNGYRGPAPRSLDLLPGRPWRAGPAGVQKVS